MPHSLFLPGVMDEIQCTDAGMLHFSFQLWCIFSLWCYGLVFVGDLCPLFFIWKTVNLKMLLKIGREVQVVCQCIVLVDVLNIVHPLPPEVIAFHGEYMENGKLDLQDCLIKTVILNLNWIQVFTLDQQEYSCP